MSAADVGNAVLRIGDVARARREVMAAALVEERRQTRAQARVQAERAAALAAQQTTRLRRRVYAAAAVGRLTADWVGGFLSADQAIRSDLRLLRDRSRQLERDNAYAARYLELARENIIGPDGIRLQCKITRPDGTLDTESNSAIESAWLDFSQAEHASVDGKHSLTQLAEAAVTAWKRDGGALLRLVPGYGRHAFAVQLLDIDLLDHTLYQMPTARQNEIRMGVEVDAWGKPLAYWLWTAHPADYFGYSQPRERIRVPAEEIIHLYTPARPGQTHGVPKCVAVMDALNTLGAYVEAEAVAARMGAAQAFVLEQDPNADGLDDDAPESIPLELEPGTGHLLPPGVKMNQFKPEHPVAAFGPFTSVILRQVAVGYNVNYVSLTGDLSAVNYSSFRGGLLQERDGWRGDQRTVAEQVYRRIFLAWLPYAALTGAVPRSAYTAWKRAGVAAWLGRGWPWVDPEKDIAAAALEVAHGFNTRSAICAGNGRTFEEVLAMLAQEQELAADYGVTLASGAPGAAGAATSTETDTGSDTTDGGAGGDGADAGQDQEEGGGANDSNGSTSGSKSGAKSGANRAAGVPVRRIA